ncbi:MAG: 50S ribosomal protein L10 [Epsilonproteobacteria bacterium]|nr:50S ribosomal protein L10 [Campylobacterota bacterium]
MTREEKEVIVNNLTEEFKTAQAVIVCDYKGMKCQELESVRALANESGTRVQVVKNSLSKIALKNADTEELALTETNILVWGEDQISACKVADKAASDYKEKFIIKTGLIEGKVAELSTIEAMAKLPSRDELIGMLLSVWTAPTRNMVTGLDNLKAKLEESA